MFTRQKETTVQNIPPLVRFSDIAPCDACGVEARLITDGIVASAYRMSGGSIGPVLRDGERIEAACTMVRSLVPCHGFHVWNLAEDGCWDAIDSHDREALSYYGTEMERA